MTEKVLIVGAASQIGESLGKVLESEKKKIITISRSENGPSYASTHYQCDVTCAEDSLPEVEGPLHGCVYLPGTINLKPFKQLSYDDFKHDWDVNFYGAVRVMQHYLKNLQDSGNGSVVLIGTVAAAMGMPFHASVASAKAAVEALGRSLAAEFAPRVRVNVVAPSVTKTPLSEKILGKEKMLHAAEERHPLHRVGEPEDIASAIAYLLSDKARWITGQTITVDGGLSTLRLF